MKKTTKVLFTTMMMAMVLVGCGNKNKEANENNEVEVMAPVEKTEIATEEEIEIKTETAKYEEVIGDVDLAATSLTMDGMQELVLGLDIPLSENSQNLLKDFYGEDFLILFPSPAYITDQTTVTKAELESIKFNIDIVISEGEAPTFISENDKDRKSLQTIGKYVVYTINLADSKYDYLKSYDIYNTETGKTLGILLAVIKVRDYQEYCDNLVEEYAPAFEEVLFNNLQ